MILVFFLLTLIVIPVLNINFKGEGYNHNLSSKEKLFLQTSLGNLGYSVATCLHQYLSIDDAFHVVCAKGKLSHIWQFGLMPNLSEFDYRMDYCGSSDLHPEIE